MDTNVAIRSASPLPVARVHQAPPICAAGSGDVFTPGHKADPGVYKPIPRLMTAPRTDVAAESRKLAADAWQQLAVASRRDGRARSPQIQARHEVLGHPRINRPYPDPALDEAGVAQNLPMDVPSKFKWLMSEPLVLGDTQDVVLLHTQYEGGPTWLDDGEYECRDFFIAVRRNPETGRYAECGSLMTRKPGFQEVFRSVGPVQAMPDNPNQFMIHLEEGTYNGIYGNHTHLYEVTANGIEQVGYWKGHRSAEEIRTLPSEKGPDEQALNNPGIETLEAMNLSRNWQTRH